MPAGQRKPVFRDFKKSKSAFFCEKVHGQKRPLFLEASSEGKNTPFLALFLTTSKHFFEKKTVIKAVLGPKQGQKVKKHRYVGGTAEAVASALPPTFFYPICRVYRQFALFFLKIEAQ